jgi:hypothetical protein
MGADLRPDVLARYQALTAAGEPPGAATLARARAGDQEPARWTPRDVLALLKAELLTGAEARELLGLPPLPVKVMTPDWDRHHRSRPTPARRRTA